MRTFRALISVSPRKIAAFLHRAVDSINGNFFTVSGQSFQMRPSNAMLAA